MTKLYQGKAGNMLSAKRRALLGATALAMMAASQNVYAGTPTPEGAVTAPVAAGPQAAVDTPVIDLLSVPLTETATGSDPISVMNDEAISVSDAETGITLSGESGGVTLVNSGAISGGIGISVTTGTFSYDPSHILFDGVVSSDTFPRTMWLPDGNGGYAETVYAYVNQTVAVREFDAAQSDAAIRIENNADITFSGTAGIQATNETGATIDIVNSGDIVSTNSTAERVGIEANTASFPLGNVTYEYTNIVPGEYTTEYRYGFNYITGVITPGERDLSVNVTNKVDDGGTIHIENNGTIDMGAVEAEYHYGPGRLSQGISATSFEGIDIVNSGTIRVSDISNGITATSAGNTRIENHGSIEIGNQSAGMFSTAGSPYPGTSNYLMSGDVTIINSGDISGGMTLEEAKASGNYYAFLGQYRIAEARGISSASIGTNRNYAAAYLEFEEIGNYYVDKFIELGLDPSEIVVPPFSTYFPDLKTYTTNILNEGTISLKDGAFGIYGQQRYGELNGVNSGTITVGNGLARGPAANRSYGIYLHNQTTDQILYGFADMYARNTQSGIIVTGDDSAGIFIRTYDGSGTVVNEGSITSGNGVITPLFTEYDRLFATYGVTVTTMGYSLGQKAAVFNSGDITVGDFATGVRVLGYSAQGAILPDRVTAAVVNSGNITGGANSTGILARGNVSSVSNSGGVTIGDKDLTGLNPYITSVGTSFDNVGYGIIAEGGYSGSAQNDGTVTTGDGTVGIRAGTLYRTIGYGGIVVQGESGVVTTGDHSIGIQVAGNLYSWAVNDGHVSTGKDSIGVDVYGGGAETTFIRHDTVDPDTGYPYIYYTRETVTSNAEDLRAVNSGIIETGDNSVGVRLLGNRKAEYHWSMYDNSTFKMRHYTGEADVTGSVYMTNSGTIRVGDNSTAVEITGERIVVEQNGEEYLLPHLVNSGRIEAGAGGAALRINASADIAPTTVDSYVVNLGTIAGDIYFGDGDDELLNGRQLVDREAVSTGNIIMSGNTIDFGGGTNTFRIERGVISVADGENAITGDTLTVQMTGAEIEARDDFITGPATLALAATPFAASANFSTLTINGDVSGTFSFAADVGAGGESDELIITGNVADGSEIGVILNPVEQLKGSVEIRPINIGGTNEADVIKVAGVTGTFAESLIGSEAHYDAATGDIVINATFGMGHLATAVTAATTMTQNWWLQSVGSYERRNPITLAKSDGVSVWASAFTDVETMRPGNDLQDVSFNQQLLGTQIGLSFAKEVGGARVSIGPMFSYGQAKAKLEANKARSTGNGWAYGVNGTVRLNGFYMDAIWQKLAMDVDFSTPDSLSGADGKTNAKGSGFNAEAGYAYKLKSGLTLAPQLQYAIVKVDLDDVASTDGGYALTEIGGKASLLRAGVTVSKSFETANGSVTPLAALSFINSAGSGDSHLLSNGVDFANDTKGTGFKAELGMNSSYKAWDIGIRTGIGDTSKSTPSLSSSLTARYRW